MPREYETLLQKNPKLSVEWHSVKNGNLTPKDVAAGANKIVWWHCEKGHEWEAQINSRNRGVGCPICFGRYQEPLAITHPKLAAEWHPEKNGSLLPSNVTAGSSKKVYWQCYACKYSWQSTVTNRKHGNGCPNCAGKIVTEENSLAFVNPSVVEQWHLTKNKSLTPSEIHAYSDKKVWWRCKECDHEWKTSPNHRTKGKTGCPKCSEKYNVSLIS